MRSPAALDRAAPILAAAAVLIASCRIVATYTVFSHTTDEPGHLACGMLYFDGTVCPYEYAPLPRAFFALGPYLAGARPHYLTDVVRDGLAILYDNYTRFLTLARLGNLPFFWLACLSIFLWGRHCFGQATAGVAVLLFSLLPTVLAHAGLATADMSQTALLSSAFFAWLLWAERATVRATIFCGAITGLAALAKFSVIIFLPVTTGLMLVWYAPAKGFAALQRRAGWSALAGITAVIIFWAGYQFTLGKFGDITVPAPHFFAALRYIAHFNSRGTPAYLLGQYSDSGWWSYYPVALALKTPIAYLILLACGITADWDNRREPRLFSPVLFAAGVMLVAMFSRINIGLRHVLPMYCGLSLVASRGVMRLLQSRQAKPWTTALTAALLGWLIWTGAAKHPDYLAYFNEFVRGEPENALVDSDLDWGQDINRLSRRLRELGAKEVSFSTLVPADLEKGHGFPPVKPVDPSLPSPGWTAVSPTWWKLRQFEFSLTRHDSPLWLEHAKPTERAGSILLFHTPDRVE